ncbi:unnamed protein product [Phytophthora lilii]|uniref:Unnamed protein product n=1 Tax=Phytophthora lilii TaxID=2077276 RepID=A0A9W6X6M6_9STRA|nr:unnamed protein product [Phytophthora lilii]
MALTRSQARRVRFAEPVTTDVSQHGVVSDVRRHCTPERKDRRNDDQNMESANEESDDNSEAGTLPVVDGSKPAEREVIRQQPHLVDVQAERLPRIRVAQDEERRWIDLKAYLRGDIESLSLKRAASASKLPDRFVIDEERLASIRGHDRDPRFMSETFQAFLELIQARSRVTLSYRPQANGQQERSVKSVIQTVKVYVKDPLQQDWDEIAEKTVHAINNSMDTTRKETPFYLVHGWDAQSTLKAMTSSAMETDPTLQLGDGRPIVNMKSRWLWQSTTKQRKRLGERKNTMKLLGESSSLRYPSTNEEKQSRAGRPAIQRRKHLIDRYFSLEVVSKNYAYELELPDKAGNRFYPVVHVSRLKAVSEDDRRPTVELVDGLSEDERFDFDEELLPEDSWGPEAGDDKYIVEAILDDRWPISTGTERRQREFYVKCRGYDKPTWELISNLSCGGILFDYLLQWKRENRLQMGQVADES